MDGAGSGGSSGDGVMDYNPPELFIIARCETTVLRGFAPRTTRTHKIWLNQRNNNATTKISGTKNETMRIQKNYVLGSTAVVRVTGY